MPTRPAGTTWHEMRAHGAVGHVVPDLNRCHHIRRSGGASQGGSGPFVPSDPFSAGHAPGVDPAAAAGTRAAAPRRRNTTEPPEILRAWKTLPLPLGKRCLVTLDRATPPASVAPWPCRKNPARGSRGTHPHCWAAESAPRSPPWSALGLALALGFSVLVGAVFRLLLALNAARLPAHALRSERYSRPRAYELMEAANVVGVMSGMPDTRASRSHPSGRPAPWGRRWRDPPGAAPWRCRRPRPAGPR